MLPPFCISIPRTDVPLETIIGVQNRKKETNSRKAQQFLICLSLSLNLYFCLFSLMYDSMNHKNTKMIDCTINLKIPEKKRKRIHEFKHSLKLKDRFIRDQSSNSIH